MVEGICPHCSLELFFDNQDNKLEVVICPNCNNIFLISEANPKNVYNNKPLNISTRTIHNQDGSIRATNGHKAQIESNLLKVVKNVSANSRYELFQKIRTKGIKLKKKEKVKIETKKALEDTEDAKEKINSINNLLKNRNIQFTWEELIRKDEYPESKPIFNLEKPDRKQALPKKNFWERLFKNYALKRAKKREDYYNNLLTLWLEEKESHETILDKWKKRKNEFYKKRKHHNKNILQKSKKFKIGNKVIIEEFYKQTLKKSKYSKDFPKKFLLEYTPQEKRLVVEYILPDLKDIPQNKEIKYIKSSRKRSTIKLSKTQRTQLYDKTLYSIPLRTIYEIFNNDEHNHIDNIVFNGWVNTIDKATGNEKTICILSIHTQKEDFNKINLTKVEPKKCFQGLKGIGSSKLSSLAPIAPILKIDKKDNRFIKEKNVLNEVDNAVNIASMDWEDFEHLVRELFEKEFAKSNMEVKVTQSSRDLGVDAVAFDTDPIRGGKIIIQAKRYTNTVKVESVRALYGIMQDEGAMKGIIVTTSNYGPDAYKFTQGKPITLINGNNLISMLEEYGHPAKIDLQEAKKELKGRTRV